MKTVLLIIISIIFYADVAAQLTPKQRIQDSIIGWDPKNYYDRNYKPHTVIATKEKEAVVNKMSEWVKASYTPVAGLGEYERFVNDDNFGLALSVWNVGYDYLDAQKHFRPIPEERTYFYFSANQVYNSNPIYFMNKKGETFFTMQPNGYAANSTEERKRKGMDKTIHSNVSKYVTWAGGLITVYLAPNNKLPMIAVTKGELLDKAEASMDGVLEDKRKEETQRWQGNPKGLAEAMEYAKKEIDQYRDNIRKLKDKYSSSLNEPALVRDMQADWRSFQAGSWDIFYGGTNTIYYPVYKFDAATIAKMRGPKPLWLAIGVPYETSADGNQLYEMYTAITQNLNYDYIYNYFFDPEKVSGKVYTPANADQLKARLTAYKNANASNENIAIKKQTALPANVVLYEDFSQDAEGGKPAGWYFSSYGKGHVVTTVEGENGHWLKLGYNNKLTSTTLKNLPEDFNLEYDMATSDFEGNWGGNILMEMKASKKGTDGVQYASFISTSITAGSQAALDAAYNYRGEVRIELVNSPSKMDYNNIGGYFATPQPYITNVKHKVHVQLLKKGDNLSMLLNGKPFANSANFKSKYGKDCGDCSIPQGLQFTNLSFENRGQNADAISTYISNIKITKL